MKGKIISEMMMMMDLSWFASVFRLQYKLREAIEATFVGTVPTAAVASEIISSNFCTGRTVL